MSVIGFGRDDDGSFKIVVEQPFIQGTRMSDEEIANYVGRLGFSLINRNNWTYSTKDIYLSDMHDENVIKSVNNNVYVVDCDIRINVPALRAGGSRELMNEIEWLE